MPASTIYTECRGCGVTFGQPDDPGRKRQYHDNACRQRAYRGRGGRASGTRYESASSKQRHAEQEAWAEQEAQRERARERMRANRGRGAERIVTPEWTHPRGADDRLMAKKRATCHLLYVRAGHESTPAPEAQTCRNRADELRARYGL